MITKRLILGSLLGILLALGAGSLRAQNLLQNSDFDTWTDDSNPAGWKIEYRSRAGIMISDQTPYPPYCVRIERRADSTGNNNGAKQDSMSVVPGEVYTISCWLRVDTLPGGTVHYTSGRIVVTWRDAAGAVIRSTNPGYVTSGDWVQFLYTDTAPTNAAMASVMIRCYGRSNPKSIAGGLVYADHAELFLGASVAEERPNGAPPASLSAAPNPFTAQVALSFSGTGRAPLHLRIYDATGQVIREWSSPGAGTHVFQWDGCDQDGFDLPGGLYFAVVEQDSRQLTVRKLLLLR